MFPMAGGRTGVMAERGPEAILPLRRGADGRLGVTLVPEGPAPMTGDSLNGGTAITVNVDARGATDPAEVEAAGYRGAQRALAEELPGVVKATTQMAHARTVSDWHRRGGRFR
jgi:phage-related minor tail protein